jgi:diguanylate cyclase (GGDEF)-like protein
VAKVGSSSRPASAGYASLASLARRLVADRPAIAWAVSLLFAFKALVCFAAAAFPVSPAEPRVLIAAIGVIVIVLSIGVWVFGRSIPLVGFELLAAAGTLTTSGLVAQAGTRGGMMVAAFQYVWTAIYAAHFFHRRGVILQGIVISVGFAVGLYLSGLHDTIIYWLIVTITIWSICLLLGHLSESLRMLADTDPLTGLLNRNGFLAAAAREHAIAERSGEPLTLAVLDLDGFKQVNDIRGHAAGDRLLAQLGRSWRERLRTGDILARHGGDEFVLLLPATSPQTAKEVLARLADVSISITWSVGISEWKAGESLSECLDRADGRLYTVKSAIREIDGASAPVS